MIFLDVSYNRITDIVCVSDLISLKSLNINNNEFVTLDKKFKNLVNLKEIGLDWFKNTLPPLSIV